MDVRAQGPQGVDEVGDGAFQHSRFTGQGIDALTDAEGGAEGSNGGAGIAEEQVGGRDGKGTAGAVHLADGSVGGEF